MFAPRYVTYWLWGFFRIFDGTCNSAGKDCEGAGLSQLRVSCVIV